MASKAGLTWTSDNITPKMRQALPRAEAYLAKLTVYYSLRTEAYAKKRAKWRDRTGVARAGLATEYRVERGSYSIDLYHRASYGIWLEVRFNQKYAIIDRSIAFQGPKFFQAANNLLARMFGGS